jgi:hypothetical protein
MRITSLATLLTLFFLAGCDAVSAPEEPAKLNADEAALLLASVDFDDLARRSQALYAETDGNFSQQDLLGILSPEEAAAFDAFRNEISNNEYFVTRYKGNYAEYFAESEALAILKRAGSTSCSVVGGDFHLSKAPCDLECASMLVAMASLVASVGGGPIAYALAVAGFALATEGVGNCLSENNMETCW